MNLLHNCRHIFRRRFCQSTAGLGALAICGMLPAAATAPRLRFGLIGINHEHVFRMVKAVRDGGGEPAVAFAGGGEPSLVEKLFRENRDARAAFSEDEVLQSPDDVKLVVVARGAGSRPFYFSRGSALEAARLRTNLDLRAMPSAGDPFESKNVIGGDACGVPFKGC